MSQLRKPRKESQVLQMIPAEKIEFRAPFDSVSASSLMLKNPSDRNVAFKIKTTAPQRYCVRPNAGTILSKGDAEIKVMLQPGGTDEKHKFMVQSIFVPDEYNAVESKEEKRAYIADLWQKPAENPVMSSKLVCVFVTETVTSSEDITSPPPYSPEVEVVREDGTVHEEPLYSHQQVEQSSTSLPKPKKSVQITESKDQSEEIRRLQAELRDALKQVEILSSAQLATTGTGQTAEQQKLFLILLFVSFMAGFIISAML